MPKKKDNKAGKVSAAKSQDTKAPAQSNGVTADSSEADKVKLMIKNMPKKVEVGSEWYIISMTWIDKWQKWVGFENSTDAREQKNPGKIQNADIVELSRYATAQGNVASTSLKDPHPKNGHQNFQLKKGMKEGTDYMLIDQNIYAFWTTLYGKPDIELKRYGIEDESGESVVEIYFKKVNVYPIPNKTFFKLDKETTCTTQPIFLSKSQTIKDLMNKIKICLNNYIYYTLREKSATVSDLRLWKHTELSIEEDQVVLEKALREIDKKYLNYTAVKLDANILNLTEEQQSAKLYDVELSDLEVLIVEIQKKNEWVFQPNTAEDEEQESEFKDPLENMKISSTSLSEIQSLDLNQMFRPKSLRGAVGLQNLGNTCFMNSGLQCLSNTMELTKFFLFGLHTQDVNLDNPLGMGGNLANAYKSLLEDLWIGKDPRTAPFDLKKVLGKKIARFSGYGQQDACELLNYLLDLIHEDLNRVKKKPYVEMPDDPSLSDEQLSAASWKAFLARNQSVVVDLMYGQLKSTVRCLTCENISITFDPFLTLSVPITKSNSLKVALVPYECYREKAPGDANKQEDSDSEEDPDYKVENSPFEVMAHPVFSYPVSAGTSVLDLKNKILEDTAKIGGKQIRKENLRLCKYKYGEIYEEWSDDDKADEIDPKAELVFLEISKEKKSEETKVLEINFTRVKFGNRGQFTQDWVMKAVPRYQEFKLQDTMLDMKKKVYKRIQCIHSKDIVPEENTEEYDEFVNKALYLQIKDNTPYQKGGMRAKVNCEFCNKKHNSNNDTCNVRSGVHKDGNSLDSAKELTLGDLYDQLLHTRELVFDFGINLTYKPKFACVQANYVKGGNNSNGVAGGMSLYKCIQDFSQDETLSGDDQWYCRKCKEHRDIKKKLELYKTPQILMVQLKRFQSKKSANNGKTGFFNLAYAQICQQEKVDEDIDFPLEGLDLKDYTVMDCESQGISTTYDLYAVTNHFGSLNGGHYTAFGKNPNGKWYNYNDGSVNETSAKNVCSNAAFVLFYRRRDDGAPAPRQNGSYTTKSTSASSSQHEEEKSTNHSRKPSHNSDDYIYELD